MRMRVIKYCLVLAITGIFILSCTASKNTFGKKYEILDIDSLGSKSYVAAIRNIDISEFKEGELKKENISVKYRLFSPEVSSKSQKFPLVLVFHGSGAIGNDHTKQMYALVKNWITPENKEKYPAYILAPQFPIRSSNYHLDPNRNVLASESNEHLDLVLQYIDSLKKQLPIDGSRIYVMGFSMGGSTTMNALSKRPDLFAAGINISGISQFDKMEDLKNIPLWYIHGSLDTDNSPKSNLQFFEEMKGKGKIFFWDCKDKWHNNIASKELIDTIPKWLFKQQKK